MSNVKFFSTNLTETATLTASTTAAFYPVTNLADDRSTKEWRSTATSGNVVYDFGSATTVNSVIVKGHAFDGFGFTGNLTIEMNATDSWGAPSFSTTLTPDTTHGIGYVNFADQSYRYLRISGSGSSYFALNNVFVGVYTQLSDNNIDFGWTYSNNDLSKIRRNQQGQQFAEIEPRQKKISATFKYLNKTEFDTICDLYDTHGKTEPIWIAIDESETIVTDKERFINQFYFSSDMKFKNSTFSLYDTKLALKETK